MDLTVNPALLGAMTCVLMLAAWALGRWQARPALSPGGPAIAPVSRAPENPQRTPQTRMPDLSQVPQRPHPDIVVGYDNAISLCDLHAEVSAFRRREQVLATLATDALLLDGLLGTSAHGRASETAIRIPMPNGAGGQRRHA